VSPFVVQIEQRQRPPGWRANLTATVLGIWESLTSAETGVPPTSGALTEPNVQWRVVVRSLESGDLLRAYEWTYERDSVERFRREVESWLIELPPEEFRRTVAPARHTP
jgi:hypothetical protein